MNGLEELEYRDFEKFVGLNDGDKALVIKVYDGDTLTIGWTHSNRNVRSSLRIRGIDTPELRSKSEEEKQMASVARSRLEEATMKKVVTLISPGLDKYGRFLCDLSTEDITSISQYMLQAKDICHEYDGGKRQPWTTTAPRTQDSSP